MGRLRLMKKIKDPELFKTIKQFLTVYLPEIRKKSKNTVESYKFAINLYLIFIRDNKQKYLTNVTSYDFNRDNIMAFMGWLEKTRSNEVTTINQRLSHIRTFCSYLNKKKQLAYADLNDIAEIARRPDQRRIKMVYLSIEDMKLILEQPDISRETGMRDKFYIALLYDSGCRNQEILDLRIQDFVIKSANEAELHVVGKGRKYRVTPITADVVKIFYEYCKIYHPNYKKEIDSYLFYTTRKDVVTQMSADNVQRFLKVYENKAIQIKPEIVHLHPHLFRHTRAMHLYMAGVPLPLVSEWLGHTNLETTQIYAQATIEMKRKASEKLAENENSVFKDDVTFKYADDDEILKKLSGLK